MTIEYDLVFVHLCITHPTNMIQRCLLLCVFGQVTKKTIIAYLTIQNNAMHGGKTFGPSIAPIADDEKIYSQVVLPVSCCTQRPFNFTRIALIVKVGSRS